MFTSNVDGQFQRAGFDPEQIVECHGSNHHLQCQTRRGIWSADGIGVSIDPLTLHADRCPLCSCCGRPARPNILMFGDMHWDSSRTDRQERGLNDWLLNLPSSARLAIVELGAGTNIPTVRNLGEHVAASRNGRLIRINPGASEGPARSIELPLGGLDALRRIEAHL